MLFFGALVADSLGEEPHKRGYSTTLIGIPFSNDTIFLRYSFLSDYFSGHYYYPGSPALSHEGFVYGKK